ncbi:MAG: SDR family NAD(P)-dependent oxidoreductase [Limisphaerales bacterium]
MNLESTSPPGARVILVTGAGGGLGGALVRTFAKAGWRVAAAGHRSPPSAAGPDSPHGEVLSCVLDVTRPGLCREVVDRVVDRWGRLDVLVNNAGIVSDRALPAMGEENWDSVLDVHLKGAFFCSQAVLPTMIRQGGGHILMIGSASGRRGAAGQVNYSAAKAGLLGLTVSLAREVAEHGVRVNAVLPGLLPTGMTAALSESARRALVDANLLGRMNSLDEVAELVLGLARSNDVSGQVFQWDSRIGRVM